MLITLEATPQTAPQWLNTIREMRFHESCAFTGFLWPWAEHDFQKSSLSFLKHSSRSRQHFVPVGGAVDGGLLWSVTSAASPQGWARAVKLQHPTGPPPPSWALLCRATWLLPGPQGPPPELSSQASSKPSPEFSVLPLCSQTKSQHQVCSPLPYRDRGVGRTLLLPPSRPGRVMQEPNVHLTPTNYERQAWTLSPPAAWTAARAL